MRAKEIKLNVTILRYFILVGDEKKNDINMQPTVNLASDELVEFNENLRPPGICNKISIALAPTSAL